MSFESGRARPLDERGPRFFPAPLRRARIASSATFRLAGPNRNRPSELERGRAMKALRTFIWNTLVGGLFIVVPVYLAVLLLLKGMQSVGALVRPIAALLPGLDAAGD